MAALKILILEDDQTQGEALRAAFSRSGFEVSLTAKTEEAQAILEKQKISYLFVDCLLPGGSGVDFVEAFRKKHPENKLAVVLLSGIFTDAAFIKDSLRSTQAMSFLKKPFAIEEALKLVKVQDKAVGDKLAQNLSPRQALYAIFRKEKVTVREKRKAIEALDQIHGFDLPFIYSLLAESKMSGHLNMATAQGDISGISFSQGNIVAVDIVDQQTYLGKLLIESGFILPEDLQGIIEVKSQKRIGERLIQAQVLSPHGFNIVLINQMSIRLSRTITDSQITVNFVEADVEMASPNIDSEALLKFLHDWIAGKISYQWLKTHYLQWATHSLECSHSFSETNPALQMPLVEKLPNFLKVITSGRSLNQIVDENIFPEEPFLKALHFLLTKGLVVISEGVVNKSAGSDVGSVLRKFSLQLSGKNKVEVFSLMAQITNVPAEDTESVYNEFLQMLGEATQVAEPAEVATNRRQLQQIAKEAYEFASSGSRERLKEDLAKNELEMKLRANSQFEDAQNSLQRGQYAVAIQLLQKGLAVDPSHLHGKIYLAWAKLGLNEASGGSKANLREIEMDLMQVSPEEKFDALYSLVMGLFYRASGDISAAKKAFEKAVNMDSTLIVARRELTRTQGLAAAKKDVLNRDLKDLVSNFFSKKK